MNTTRELIAQRVKEKPIPSMIAFEILKIIENENHSLKDVVKIVENDASLTSEVLKMANSAAYFRGEPVTTVNRALLMMGEMMVVGVAICASTSIVYHSPLEGYDSKAGEMWEHSLRSAIAAREISRFSKVNISPGLAFTAGLLHDIGKSVLSEFLIGTANAMVELCEQQSKDYLEAEQAALGTDHTQVGFELAKHWGLPETLCVGIRDHHKPSKAPEKYKPLVYTIHLGDLISMIGGIGTGSDAMSYSLDNTYEDFISIDKDELSLLLLKVEDEYTTVKNTILSKGKA